MNAGTRSWPISARFLSTIGACLWALASAACSGDNKPSPLKTSPDASMAIDASPEPEGGARMDGTAAEASASDGGADGGATNEAGAESGSSLEGGGSCSDPFTASQID